MRWPRPLVTPWVTVALLGLCAIWLAIDALHGLRQLGAACDPTPGAVATDDPAPLASSEIGIRKKRVGSLSGAREEFIAAAVNGRFGAFPNSVGAASSYSASWIFSEFGSANSNFNLAVRLRAAIRINRSILTGTEHYFHDPELSRLIDDVHQRFFSGSIHDRNEYVHELARYLVDHADQCLAGLPQYVIENLKHLETAVLDTVGNLDHALFFDIKPGMVAVLFSLGKYAALVAEAKTSVSLALTLIVVETSAATAGAATSGKAALVVLGWLAKILGFAVAPVLGVVVAGAAAYAGRRATMAGLKTAKKKLGGVNDLATFRRKMNHSDRSGHF
jgi:hypothetical protein